MEKPIIQELDDGRIIKDDGEKFTELINGKWVEPVSVFYIGDFLDGKRPSPEKLKGAI